MRNNITTFDVTTTRYCGVNLLTNEPVSKKTREFWFSFISDSSTGKLQYSMVTTCGS
jgi:hypothetical protein